MNDDEAVLFLEKEDPLAMSLKPYFIQGYQSFIVGIMTSDWPANSLADKFWRLGWEEARKEAQDTGLL